MFGEAFEVVPRTIAESAGLDATEVLSRLYAAAHKKDEWTNGVDIEVITCPPSSLFPRIWLTSKQNDDNTGILDAKDEGILDLLAPKHWAIKLATEAARTVLSVDQIIVARQAGGPKPPGPNPVSKMPQLLQ